MRYAEQLERLFGEVERERVHVILADEFRADPTGVYRGVLEFLDVAPGFAPALREVNPSKVRRSPALHATLKWLFARPARRWLPLELRLRAIDWVDRLTTREAPAPPLRPRLAARLRAECRPDVERLGRLLGRDLTAWSQA